MHTGAASNPAVKPRISPIVAALRSAENSDSPAAEIGDQRRGASDLPNLIRSGLADHQAGRLRQAEAAYRQVLAIVPAHAGALYLLGVVAHQSGRHDSAIDCFQRAIASNRALPEAHNDLGKALRGLGRFAEAEASYREALRLRPDWAEVHNNLAAVLFELRRPHEAEASCREALRLRPDYPDAHNNLAVVLLELDRAREAETSCREALRLRPDYPEARNSLGGCLQNLGRFAEAEAIYREVLRLRPSYAAHHNLGNVLYVVGRLDEATASYREALRMRPDEPEAHANLARALLMAGRFEEGWKEHEWRWKTRHMSRSARNFAAPLWRGEAIGERVILLHAEQGLGDTLQFCRYAPLVAASARVVLEVPVPLVRLLSRMPGIEAIVAEGDALPSFDLHCPLMSLPRAFHTTLDTIPAAVPYLSASPAHAAAWRARLADLDGLRVGLVWAGRRRMEPDLSAADARRSIALQTMAPLAEASGVSFVSLQKGEARAQGTNPPRGMVLHDFTADLHDMMDTAALVENLDLVISVDTAVAHLAGALGKPVWLLSRFDTCWRWLLDRDDSPWYPTLRQFRQPAPGDWDSVLQAAREALQRLAAGDRDQLRLRNQAASASPRASVLA